MIELRLSDITEEIGASLLGNDAVLRGVSVDTRTLKPDDVFFALTGEQFDAHTFVKNAVQLGASSVVVERECGVDVPQLLVRNTRAALGQIAAMWSRQSKACRVALTGSNGKTTVKEMLCSVLSRLGETVATEGNLNNDVGLPLTLFRLDETTEYAVLEMGASQAGEIDWLASLVKPHVALVNNVGPAHLDGFGSLQGVAEAKGEIFEHIVDGGVAIMNRDEFAVNDWVKRASVDKFVGFSMQGEGDLAGHIVADGKLEIAESGKRYTIELPLTGDHNLQNALAVAAVCRGLDIAWPNIESGLASIGTVPGRLVPRTFGSVQVFDDSYNANPASTHAALKVLANQSGGRRWCVLGEMAELGEASADLHAKVGEQAAQLGIECFMSIGKHAIEARRGFGERGVDYSDQDLLVADLIAALHPGDSVLVKGSRSAGMESVVSALRAALGDQRA